MQRFSECHDVSEPPDQRNHRNHRPRQVLLTSIPASGTISPLVYLKESFPLCPSSVPISCRERWKCSSSRHSPSSRCIATASASASSRSAEACSKSNLALSFRHFEDWSATA